MMDLPDRESQEAALRSNLDPKLRDLIAGRAKDALAIGLEDLTHIVVVQAGDTESDLVEAMGFSPLVSRIDGVRGQQDWDWREQHDGWFELVYTIGNSGFAFILLVEEGDELLTKVST